MSAPIWGRIDMEIKVTFDHGRLTFSPDPAIVRRGTLVSWRFQTNELPFPQLQWVVYFNKGSPFRDQGDQFITDTPVFGGKHIVTSPEMSADDPGDYKYGVRVVNSANQHELGDDDPRLIVV
jgi:hypothetical protein